MQVCPYRDYHGNGDDHSTDHGAPPAIDLGPANQPGNQPQPEPTGNGADQKPGAYDPGEPKPPPQQPGGDMDHNVVNSGNENTSTNDSTPPKNTNPDDPATSPSNPGPDPGADGNRPDIPIFLGPSNADPSPGNSSPPSDSPQDSGYYEDDDGRYAYPDETSCDDDRFGEPLINLLSGNGGDGGDASSGAATRQETISLVVHVANLNTF
jgi:hypothetical protein